LEDRARNDFKGWWWADRRLAWWWWLLLATQQEVCQGLLVGLTEALDETRKGPTPTSLQITEQLPGLVPPGPKALEQCKGDNNSTVQYNTAID